MTRSLLLLLTSVAVFVLSGCVLDTIADCHNLCERYAECFDSSADVDACTTRCQSRVDSGESDRADRCDSCLDDNPTCATAVASCTSQCGPLLAP